MSASKMHKLISPADDNSVTVRMNRAGNTLDISADIEFVNDCDIKLFVILYKNNNVVFAEQYNETVIGGKLNSEKHIAAETDFDRITVYATDLSGSIISNTYYAD